MKTKIFYFSGTGNSLHAAKKIAAGMEDAEIIPILHYRDKKETITVTADSAGFVFPVYAFSIPLVVENFMKKIDLRACGYIFAVATRGASPCRLFYDMDKILKKQGKQLSAYFFLDMVQNYIPAFEIATGKEMEALCRKADDEISRITEVVSSREQHQTYEKGYWVLENILFRFFKWLFRTTRFFSMENGFYAEEACNGCGLCEKICLSGKISLKLGRPEWNRKTSCYNCLACIHSCPQKAIQIKITNSREKDRYMHPEISVKEIAVQKE